MGDTREHGAVCWDHGNITIALDGGEEVPARGVCRLYEAVTAYREALVLGGDMRIGNAMNDMNATHGGIQIQRGLERCPRLVEDGSVTWKRFDADDEEVEGDGE